MCFTTQVFNGGSDFNEPVKRCLDRLTDAKWANSDILLVSDGELRQPGVEIMRKLSGRALTDSITLFLFLTPRCLSACACVCRVGEGGEQS
jgi:hypothetical protein